MSCSSLSGLCLPGESVSCRMQGIPLAVGVTSFCRLVRRVFFPGGLGTSRRRRVIQGTDTSSRVHLQVHVRHTSRRYRLTGDRHITSLPSTRVQCPLCGDPSESFYLHRFHPGSPGVTGIMGILIDLSDRIGVAEGSLDNRTSLRGS